MGIQYTKYVFVTLTLYDLFADLAPKTEMALDLESIKPEAAARVDGEALGEIETEEVAVITGRTGAGTLADGLGTDGAV